jgi:hypothetical protein
LGSTVFPFRGNGKPEMVDSIRKEEESWRTCFPDESIVKKSGKPHPGRPWPSPDDHDNFHEGVTSSRNLALQDRLEDERMFPVCET